MDLPVVPFMKVCSLWIDAIETEEPNSSGDVLSGNVGRSRKAI